MTDDTPTADALEPEPIPDPSQPDSEWRIVQIVAAPPGWHTMSGSSRLPKTIKRDVAVWALLQERGTGRQVIRGYVEEPGEGGSLIDAQAEVAQSNREWFGYTLDAPPQPAEAED